MKKLYNAGLLRMSLAVFSTIVLASALSTAARADGPTQPAAAPFPCFQVLGQAACRTPAELKDLGVVAVRFVVQSLQRNDASTSWGLFGFKAGSPVALLVNLVGTLPVAVQTEDGVLTAQQQLCDPLVAAGIACSRDHLAGSWFTYALPDGSPAYSVTFTTKSVTALSAKGSVETKRLACRRGAEVSDDLLEIEVACTGDYDTSLRLAYLANAAYLTFSGVNCAETGKTHAPQFGALNLPECPAPLSAQTAPFAAYPAAQWFPLGTTATDPQLNYTVANAMRTYLQQSHTALYRTGF